MTRCHACLASCPGEWESVEVNGRTLCLPCLEREPLPVEHSPVPISRSSQPVRAFVPPLPVMVTDIKIGDLAEAFRRRIVEFYGGDNG